MWFLAEFYEIFAVFCENARTSLQITFPTKPTGIYFTMTYNRHIPDKNDVSFFTNSPDIEKNYPSCVYRLIDSKSAGLRGCFSVVVTNIILLDW